MLKILIIAGITYNFFTIQKVQNAVTILMNNIYFLFIITGGEILFVAQLLVKPDFDEEPSLYGGSYSCAVSNGDSCVQQTVYC